MNQSYFLASIQIHPPDHFYVSLFLFHRPFTSLTHTRALYYVLFARNGLVGFS